LPPNSQPGLIVLAAVPVSRHRTRKPYGQYSGQVKLVSWMRWQDDDTELKLLETATELHISIINSGIDQPVATYERGQIRSILDAHSTARCTLHVHADDGTTQQFQCDPKDCTPLLGKLRKF
jgi:hypothetical protein